jgi:hypothetical protein
LPKEHLEGFMTIKRELVLIKLKTKLKTKAKKSKLEMEFAQDPLQSDQISKCRDSCADVEVKLTPFTQ